MGMKIKKKSYFSVGRAENTFWLEERNLPEPKHQTKKVVTIELPEDCLEKYGRKENNFPLHSSQYKTPSWLVKKGDSYPKVKNYYDTSTLIKDGQDLLYEVFKKIGRCEKNNIKFLGLLTTPEAKIFNNKVWEGVTKWEIGLRLPEKFGIKKKAKLIVEFSIQNGRFVPFDFVKDTLGNKIPFTKNAILSYVQSKDFVSTGLTPDLSEKLSFPWLRNIWHFDPSSPASGFLSLGSRREKKIGK